jgi:3-oxoacyl-[acyl-carrier protein] reductase
MRLKDKVAIVTGAGRGIGRAIALAFAKEGANIVVNDINIELANKVVEEIKALGRKAIAIKADVSKSEEVEKMVDLTIKEFGKIDILVNNAGVVFPARIIDIKEENWDRTFEVNLKGTFLCSKAVLKHMMQRKSGKIICIASNLGILSIPERADYSASKAGVINFVKSLALEAGPYGINVNAIAPGITETDMIKPYVTKEMIEKEFAPNIPLRRIGKPEDIAKVAVFFASEDSDYVTGQVISVDGGGLIAGKP